MKIELRSNKYPGYYAEVDKEDYDLINSYKWRLFKTPTKSRDNFYATTDYYDNGKRTTIYMHRLIMGTPKRPMVVDHIDGNGLNNKKDNLRIVTQRENAINSCIIIANGGCKFERGYSSSVKAVISPGQYELISELTKSLNISLSQLFKNALFEYLLNHHSEYIESNYPEILEILKENNAIKG